uniref:Armadillo repeat containing 6 n=1 Tax=Neogobius melanostomus TaxID=47308 RepID=A0A8C6TVS7_9GOBI
MEEFEMASTEALNEAVEQFESQGVDLSCIVKAVPAQSSADQQEDHHVLQALNSIRSGNDLQIRSDIKLFTEQCSLGFAQRFLAAQKGAYAVILSFCKNSETQDAVQAGLLAFAALTDGQPDLLDVDGNQFLLDILKKYQDSSSVMCAAIRTVRHCCLKHEQNRQNLIKGGVLPLLTGAITQHSACAELLKEASTALRVMTFDDDVRVTFGNAHEHAKMIVLEHNGLKVLIDAAKAHLNNTTVLSEICATLSRLAVRNEFCQDICDLGGLKLIMTLLADNYDSQDLARQVLSAIRAIAGNDDIKDAVANAGGVQLIVMAMNRHMGNAAVCEQGCACLSMLALRKPNNCKMIMEDGGAMAAVQAMKTHPKVVNVQKSSCILLRNLVSRMRNYNQPILEMGAESLITQALQNHKDCNDVCKAALRDLGCQVELRELWTGKHGGITN